MFDVVIAGHFAKDRDVYLGKARPMLGGASYFGGHVLACLKVRGAILTRCAEKERALLDPLAEKGVSVLCRYGTATTGIENTYLDETRDRRTCRAFSIGEPFQVEDFPRLRTTIVHIAPLICGEAPPTFVEKLGEWGLLSLDAQGFLRVHKHGTLKLEKNDAFPSLLKKAAFLKLDHAEAEVLTGAREIPSALERILDMGVREIVLTHTEGVTACMEGQRWEASWSARTLIGRTGRGDTCMAAYLACRSLELGPEQALPIAASVTSRKMEKEGPFTGTLEDVEESIAAPLRQRLSERGTLTIET